MPFILQLGYLALLQTIRMAISILMSSSLSCEDEGGFLRFPEN